MSNTPKFSCEVIQALSDLRILAATMRHDKGGSTGAQMAKLVDILDNDGVFADIDEITGYDINPDPYLPLGDPAEMGDLVARVSIIATGTDQSVHCTQHGEISRHAWAMGTPRLTEKACAQHIADHNNAQVPTEYATLTDQHAQLTQDTEPEIGLPTLPPGADIPPPAFSDTHPRAARELGEEITGQ